MIAGTSETLVFDWLLNKSFIEILLHIELNSVDFVESRLNSFVRKYRAHFDKTEHIQAMEFLKLVQDLLQKMSLWPILVHSEKRLKIHCLLKVEKKKIFFS